MADSDDNSRTSFQVHMPSIGTIALIVTQLVTFVWFFAGVSNRVENNEAKLQSIQNYVQRLEERSEARTNSLQSDISLLRSNLTNQAVQLGRIEENLTSMRAILERLARAENGGR